MSAVADSRSIAYSADTTGRAGRIACQIIRSPVADDRRVAFTLMVRNDTSAQALAAAVAHDAAAVQYRTVVQSIVGPHAVFSTCIELELDDDDAAPELHVTVGADDIELTLIVPRAPAQALSARDREPQTALVPRVAGGGAAHQTPVVALLPMPVPVRTKHSERDPAPGRPSVTAARHQVLGPAYRSPPVVLIIAASCAVVGVAGALAFRPQIGALDLPANPTTPSAIVGYQATGWGRLGYRVMGPDGDAVAAGPLAPGAGSFKLTFPHGHDERTYFVRVVVSGPLGTAEREGYVHVPAAIPHATVAVAPARRPRDAAPPLIRSLAVDRALIAGGDTLNVYYDVAATGGSVVLLDAGSQIAYGKSPLSPQGHTAFVVPVAVAPRFLTVVLSAERGGVSVQSRSAVTVGPAPSPTPSDGDATLTDGAAAGAAPLLVAPNTVRGGTPIRIEVRNAASGMTLVLTDADGSELARRELGPSDGPTIFEAPAVSAPTSIRLQVTYPQGAGSETIVHPIVVTPH